MRDDSSLWPPNSIQTVTTITHNEEGQILQEMQDGSLEAFIGVGPVSIVGRTPEGRLIVRRAKLHSVGAEAVPSS